MIEKVMKVVKNSNKKRSRNITTGTVIGFLLSCTAVMGTDETALTITVNDSEIEFNGKKYDSKTHGFSENTFDGQTYTNNTEISSISQSGTAYGIKIKLYGLATPIEVINNGVISAHGASANAYGIYNDINSKVNLINNGTIYATDSQTDTFGIYNNGGIITELNNRGTVFIKGSSTKVHGITNINKAKIIELNNSGTILSVADNMDDGFGVYNEGIISKLNNNGIISGTNTTGIASGVYNYNEGTITRLDNSGKIFSNRTGDKSGYGIYNSVEIGNITNTGVIYGKDSAIKNDTLMSNVGTIKEVNNYGILVNGTDQDVNDGINISNNYGLIIKNEGKNQGDITAGATGDQDISFYDNEKNITGERKVTIENVTGKNDDKSNSFSGDKENHILNALKNTYKVTGENNNVTGSIINAYGTAVVFGDTGGNNQLTLSGTTVNGGIDESDPNTKGIAISGSNNGDTLILQSGEIKYKDNNGEEKSATQNTIVNGNIDMGAGDDKLIVGSGTVLNGDVAMGAGDDELEIENGAVINGKLDGGIGTNSTLNFNSTTARTLNSDKINIMHNISNFKNMNINTNVTLYEKTIDANGVMDNLKVTGVDKITIGKDGNLILRIDGTNNNSHALSTGNTSGIIESDGGKLLLALNGVGEGSTINIGMNLGNGLYGIENEEIIYGDKFTLDSTSLLHSVKKTSNTEVLITTKTSLPKSPAGAINYDELDKIYQSMRDVDGVKEFDVDTNKKLSTFLGYLNDIYAGNPYSYSSELSRKSVGMFRDIAVESQFKPELNKWLIMGGLTHVDGGTKDTYYGKGYYTYDIGSSDMDADTKITGAYMLGEYGVSDTLTYGVVIGGNKLKSELSNGSKVDGDALYMGAYAKKYVGNLKVTGGLGLQYGDYDADRFAAGKGITETRSYSDNYNDMIYDIYLNGRYSHNIGENLFLEPYGTLSYTYIKQDSADEGNKTLAIETDSKSFDYTAAKVGVDLKKVIPHEKGKSTLSAGVSYTRLLNGADKENITGRFKGGSDFDILVAHKNEHSIGLNAKYALELENGVLFDVKGSYNVERDSHNGSGKNRTKGEWIVGVGIGYKF